MANNLSPEFQKIAFDASGNEMPVDAANPLPVRDDYAQGEVLPDQTGAGAVLTFTFAAPVAAFWVAVVGDSGVCKVDHYGGTPSSSQGIPVEAGGVMPIPEPASTVKVFAPSGLVVTVWGHLRG